MTIDTYIQQAREFDSNQRLELVQRLWDSIAADQANVPVTTSQRAELDRRLSALHAEQAQGKSLDQLGEPWDVVKRRITEP